MIYLTIGWAIMTASKISKQVNETRTQKKSMFLLKTRFFNFLKLSVAVVANSIFGHNSVECFEHKLHYLVLITVKRKIICRIFSSRLYFGKPITQIDYVNLNGNSVPKWDFEILGS